MNAKMDNLEQFLLTANIESITSSTLVFLAFQAVNNISLSFEELDKKVKKVVDIVLIKIVDNDDSKSRITQVYKAYHEESFFFIFKNYVFKYD
jgi:hypothetical protein